MAVFEAKYAKPKNRRGEGFLDPFVVKNPPRPNRTKEGSDMAKCSFYTVRKFY